MAINEDVLKNMDEAAKTAKLELDKLSPESVELIAEWWKQNYLKAGHKRLAKLLLDRIR
jgi:hypothetical protein